LDDKKIVQLLSDSLSSIDVNFRTLQEWFQSMDFESKKFLYNFTYTHSSSEGAHVHICLRQMCLSSSEGAHVHICLWQMCLSSPEGAHVHIRNVFILTFRCSRTHSQCVYPHLKVLTYTFAMCFYFNLFSAIMTVIP